MLLTLHRMLRGPSSVTVHPAQHSTAQHSTAQHSTAQQFITSVIVQYSHSHASVCMLDCIALHCVALLSRVRALVECLNEHLFNCHMLLPQAPTVVRCQKFCSNLGIDFVQVQGFVWFWTPCNLCPHSVLLIAKRWFLDLPVCICWYRWMFLTLKLKSEQKSLVKKEWHLY